uniref:Ig-like domain-containing protein n=1 Tax=Chrysemys picta bellii TaxID=8478 RepID=A0A8C3FRF8_CHRPI
MFLYSTRHNATTILIRASGCHCFSSQQLQSLKASEFVSPGGTVTLSCSLSRYNIDSYRVRWYQQKLGSAPQFVYHYKTSGDQGRGTGIPARFTVSSDTSNNLWNLVISGVQAEDDADYYCAVWDGSSNAHHSDTMR